MDFVFSNDRISKLKENLRRTMLELAQIARALEAVELIAGSYGRKEMGGKVRGLRERMEGD